MKAPQSWNPFTQELDPYPSLEFESVEEYDALQANTSGYTIVTVAGTAIAGTRTSATVFTRSSGVWYDRVIIDISAIVASGGFSNFAVGETITETTSGATGVVEEVSTVRLVMKTITLAFTGGETLTGGTTGVTATGGTANNIVTNLKGQLVWSHASGTLTAGSWLRIVSNTASAITIDGALHTTGTAVIIVANVQRARDAMDLTLGTA